MDIQYTYPTDTPKLAMERSARSESVVCGSGVCFKDILDTVNPLQQIPIVSSLYRSETGDTISTFARLAGGALLGGPLGFAVAAVNAGIEAVTGNDISGHLMAMAGGAASPERAAHVYQNASKLAATV